MTRLAVTRRRSKYGAVSCVVDGITFASQREARRYRQLKLLERAHKIEGLELQPRFALTVKGVKIGEYRADFRYHQCGDVVPFAVVDVVEDAKGVRTPLYRWKRKHLLAEHGIEVIEV